MAAQGLARSECVRNRFGEPPRHLPRIDQRPKVAEEGGEKTQSNPESNVQGRWSRIQGGAFRANQPSNDDIGSEQHRQKLQRRGDHGCSEQPADDGRPEQVVARVGSVDGITAQENGRDQERQSDRRCAGDHEQRQRQR